ncbi:bifunctional riboflavin kinase/FAD synthetase [bacterium]|nr:bifunctional riboflavin kinase/FAD synthetase [bacterium]
MMEVIRGLENVKTETDSAVTVGSFDGMHLGHRRILRRMKECNHNSLTVITFDPHPRLIVEPYGEPPPLLTTFKERIRLFEELGVDRLIIIRFDEEFARITAEDFVKTILLDKIGMSHIFIGPRHGFGAGREGNATKLIDMAKQLGFDVVVVPPVIRNGKFVSSSRIRKCLLNGDVLSSFRFMSRPFYLTGKVVVGEKRGKELGFPTANLKLDKNGKLTPKSGVFASVAEVNGERFPSVTHYGTRPTFQSADPVMETHIIDFSADVYGKTIAVGLVEQLRSVELFDSPKKLTTQISLDRSNAYVRLIEKGFGPHSSIPERRFGRI